MAASATDQRRTRCICSLLLACSLCRRARAIIPIGVTLVVPYPRAARHALAPLPSCDHQAVVWRTHRAEVIAQPLATAPDAIPSCWHQHAVRDHVTLNKPAYDPRGFRTHCADLECTLSPAVHPSQPFTLAIRCARESTANSPMFRRPARRTPELRVLKSMTASTSCTCRFAHSPRYQLRRHIPMMFESRRRPAAAARRKVRALRCRRDPPACASYPDHAEPMTA